MVTVEQVDFNPRSPHGERHLRPPTAFSPNHFNPRSPHGERRDGINYIVAANAISTHAPRTGSDDMARRGCLGQNISTHAPRTGSDGIHYARNLVGIDFNPRSPHGERPTCARVMDRIPAISTHAPRTGSDNGAVAIIVTPADFNPRSPHGERRITGFMRTMERRFQPTLPARGATGGYNNRGMPDGISTHAPRTGSDTLYIVAEYDIELFQPTLPARGATVAYATCLSLTPYFNPRSPCGERRRSGGVLHEH